MIIQQLPTIFDVESLIKECEELQEKTTKEEVYSNMELFKEVSKQLKISKQKLDYVNNIKSKINDLTEFIQICEMETDEGLVNDINESLVVLEKEVQDFYLSTLLNKKYDSNNAYVKIHSGAGGTESCDWVQMLYRMYTMFCEKNKFKVKLIDSLDGDGAGLKSVTFMVMGDNAYGYLKGESGVHRLVRISPFDANKRRHTSFASIEVMPEIDNNIDIEIKDEDIRIDTYRSSGAGGQHVNTTDSAIRITHFPTGIVVTCQNERSQLQNKEMAFRMLKSKLVALELEKSRQESLAIKGEAKKIEWGSQIRSYVFCPYTLVKDLRTDYETSNLDSVMNGDIKQFLIEYLKWNK